MRGKARTHEAMGSIRWNVLALGAVLVLAAQGAVAADGRLEINQTCAAVGCFAGDVAGLPVTTQAWKSFVLTSDLIVPDANTNGVLLGEGATLDLNGFSIRGPITCTGNPATCSGSGTGRGVIGGYGGRNTVHDGSIIGMGDAGLQSGSSLVAERLRIESNGGAGIVFNIGAGTDVGLVRGCSVSRNGAIGVYANFGSGRGVLIESNVIEGNASDGIRGNSGLVRGNRVSSNGGYGLNAAYGGEGTAFGDNAFFNNNGGKEQTSGGIQLGQNVCQTDTICP